MRPSSQSRYCEPFTTIQITKIYPLLPKVSFYPPCNPPSDFLLLHPPTCTYTPTTRAITDLLSVTVH